MNGSNLEVRPVTQENWHDLERLFEAKGRPNYCWCMAWRPMENRSTATNGERKRALQSRVLEGTPVGIIGYVGGEPVAWCSVAPRRTLSKLRQNQEDRDASIWSITCFFVRRDHRHQGLARQMLEKAIDFAKAAGATLVEAYPVDANSPSYRFMGFVPLFEGQGFRHVGKAGSRRHVMQREI